MFEGFDREMIPFFLDLRFHNSKAFMDANRDRYRIYVREPFCAFIDALGPRLQVLFPDMEIRSAKCLSRINRDTRFSRDKSPYRDHLWAAFRQSGVGKDGMPFYWFEIRPEEVSWGVGLWGENSEAMETLRRRIVKDPAGMDRCFARLDEVGCLMAGPEWKKKPVPEGLGERNAALYRKKAVYFEKTDTRLEWIYSPDIVDRVYRDFALLKPWYDLLRGCIPPDRPDPAQEMVGSGIRKGVRV